ncbi:hypothetical protein B0H16DRAFT_1780969 [Mycena metata]|uniref:Uncharacterized protein n=1 Tax=Mycena metata TaxID=1033252 RepID=A0AAD7NPG4_9AGAR|nr:hypothetical protein B0H16DRAFT_1780969 [Mycena metata]
MAPSLTSANLVLFTAAGLFYGMYLVLFCISTYLLVRRRGGPTASDERRKRGSIFTSMLFLSAILLFVVITVHWIATVYRAFIGFVCTPTTLEAELYFGDLATPAAVIQDAFLVLSYVIGDSMIVSVAEFDNDTRAGLKIPSKIYRLWVVWIHNKLVLVVPIITLTAFTVVSSVSTSVVSHSRSVFDDPLLKYTPILTLITNVYCTSFIGWKIWTITRLSLPSGGTKLRHFLVIVVESAALYALWAVLFLVAFETKSNLQVVVIQAGPELIGLVNALIMTRVGLGWTSEQIHGTPYPSALIFAASGDSTGR